MIAGPTLAPSTLESLIQAVCDHDQVLAVGNRTKPRMSSHQEATLISTASLTGMIQYEPSEFTFTAWAGTRLSELSEILQAKGQYLPFDPLLMESGATLGGTVASGLSGPGRYRYGGIRDFILGTQFVTGDGQVIVGGGQGGEECGWLRYPQDDGGQPGAVWPDDSIDVQGFSAGHQ